MLGLSLCQPWASLLAVGAKRHETRSWMTSYRGLLAIHATKEWNEELDRVCETEPFASALEAWPGRLVLGAIVAVGNLTTVTLTAFARPADGRDAAFGDWAPGRYAWRIEDVVMLPEPVYTRGMQGLWAVPANRWLAVVRQLDQLPAGAALLSTSAVGVP